MEKFGSKQKSRTFALPFEKRVSEKTTSSTERLAARREKIKIFDKKFGSLKIMLTFASPFEKRASQEENISSLKRLITVQEASTEKIQFIEKR